MALERELPVWTASLALGEDVTTSTLLVRGGIDWLGASPAELADVARARLQGTIDKGGSPRTHRDSGRPGRGRRQRPRWRGSGSA